MTLQIDLPAVCLDCVQGTAMLNVKECPKHFGGVDARRWWCRRRGEARTHRTRNGIACPNHILPSSTYLNNSKALSLGDSDGPWLVSHLVFLQFIKIMFQGKQMWAMHSFGVGNT